MFIRKTRLKNPKTQEVYYNFQLVESVRTERGPRQRILLNLGAHLDLDDKERKLLANRIEELLKGIQSLVMCPETIEHHAQRYAQQLLNKLSVPVDPQETLEEQTPPDESRDLQTIDVNTIEQQEPRSVGAEHLLLHLSESLQIRQKFRELGMSDREAILGLAIIIARAAFPTSERATYEWLCKRSGLGELLDFDFQTSRLDHLYQIGDLLLQHKTELERHLEQVNRKVHNLNNTLALYDLTNTYLAGQAKQNPKARHGVSKEKRTDCPLVTLGLVIDEHGFISRSSVLPGNVSEIKTLQDAIEQLELQESLLKPIVVLDAGIASNDNLKWLREAGYRYVVSSRQNPPSMNLKEPLVSAEAQSSEVQVAYVHTDSTEERWLYCESREKAAVASQMRQLFQERFETDLKKLAEGLAKPKGRKKHTKVLERLGRLREKHKHVSGCYEITVQPTPNGELASSISWTLTPGKLEARLNGHYFLRTNILDMDAPSLWQLYGNLRTVEDSFRFMKSSLGLRPVYHQKEARVDAHLWITVLAYHLIKNCLHILQSQGITDQWETIRNTLSSRMRVTMRAKTAEDKMLYHRSTTRSEASHDRIYKALGISSQISKTRKTIL